MSENTIHSLLIDLQLPDDGQQEAASYANELYEAHIHPILDRTISDLGGTNDLEIDDEVVIDLGEVDPSDIEVRLSNVLSQEIKRRIHAPQSTPASIHGTPALPTQEEERLPFFFAFLANETVPWQYDVETFDAPAYLSEALSLITKSEDLRLQLREAVKGDKRILWRLLAMAEPASLIQIYEILLPAETFPEGNKTSPEEGNAWRKEEQPDKREIHHSIDKEEPQALAYTLDLTFLIQLEKLMERYGLHPSDKFKTFLQKLREKQPKQSDTTIKGKKNHTGTLSNLSHSTSSNGKRKGHGSLPTEDFQASSHRAEENPESLQAIDNIEEWKESGEAHPFDPAFIAQLEAQMEKHGLRPSDKTMALLKKIKEEYTSRIISAYGEEKQSRNALDAHQAKEGSKPANENRLKDSGKHPANESHSKGKKALKEESGNTMRELLLEIERQSIAGNTMEPTPHRIHVNDAGIVLLHPFLTAYFSQLRLIDQDKQFKSVEEQIRAVHLLKHLSGDDATHHSHRLAMEKMMCGLSPEFPIDQDFHITKEEEQESEAMLTSLCQYWRPLNGSSIAGLQQSFFLRHGTIEYTDDTWIVRVEGSAIDILLEDLPWEISTILLPWMEPMILVEWQQE